MGAGLACPEAPGSSSQLSKLLRARDGNDSFHFIRGSQHIVGR
jgi:hypothetical protein